MFLRFLIICILLLYVVRLLFRYLAPILFQSLVNKAQQGQQNYGRPNQANNNPTGRIKIDYIPEEATKSKVPDTEGDFVDYVEIKEK
ncbi:DUF4834 family protein [Mucilaginibacter auburnensis]|uniref:DUF4834 domain-containing protein n=1 Tax=Mucilaginibacter auburnensis TaxID=1457233 RepID=A0A2H9VPZ4_9SPHI|nr:DUF4834 domain-containing protein [Mucilaginibacter auburnensis]PJJ80403.1 hypothetical protein CLV57_3554 [Mucilaginibacter auburnensis]